MSDYNSSLPVRTENAGDIAAIMVDGTITSQKASVDSHGSQQGTIADASGNLVTSQANGSQRALDVGINVAGVQIDPRSIRALTSADVVSVVQSTSPWITSDLADGSLSGGAAASKSSLAGLIYNSTPLVLTNGQQAALQGDASGYLKVDIAASAGTINVAVVSALPAGANVIGAVTQSGGPWSSNITQIGGSALSLGQAVMASSIPVVLASNQSNINVVVASALPAGANVIGAISNTSFAATQATASALNATVVGTGTFATQVTSLPSIPAGSNLIGAVNLDLGGSPVSNTNPVPVTIATSASGTAIQNYQTSASLAAGSTATFTYTVAATHTFNLQRVWASASGKIKAVLQNNASTIMVGFNSTANPNIDMTIISPPTIAAGIVVTVLITNEDKAAFDVYMTIEGNQN